jgi:antitoxin PrlF
MFFTSTLTSKGQITLPAKVRKELGVDTGDTIIFDYIDDKLTIRKAKKIETLFNSLPPLDFSFKEKLEEEIAQDSWSSR